MARRSIKRGDDVPISVKNVRSAETGQLLPDVAVSWKLYDRTNTVVTGAEGNATLYDEATAWFKFMIPKAITAILELAGEYRLDVFFVHTGKQVSQSVDLVAVDNTA